MEAVAFALGLEDVAAVGEPVERGAGQAFAAEDLGPVLERQVRRHDQAVPLIRSGDHVKQEFGSPTSSRPRCRAST